MSNTLDKQYTDLLREVLEKGSKKSTRNGETLSLFGRTIRHNMKDGAPALTTKKIHFKSVVSELLWMLRGESNIKSMVDEGVNIWVGDALKRYRDYEYKDYQKFVGDNPGLLVDFQFTSEKDFINNIKVDKVFANKWGELGNVYGKQWREWTYMTRDKREDIEGVDELICGVDIWDGITWYRTFDQIQKVVNELKSNPDSRRLLVSAWNVADIDSVTLPPCHYSFQFYTRELSLEEKIQWVLKNCDVELENLAIIEEAFKPTTPSRYISIIFNMRSNDLPLGCPFNVLSYSLLLSIIAKELNMIPEEVIGNLGDCHIYTNQIEGITEQLSREPFPTLPTFKFSQEFEDIMKQDIPFSEKIPQFKTEMFTLENYQSHPSISIPLSN